ncbi:MAG: Calx-beta domain-containing protein [Verrucomicrobiales bacterium]
MINIVRTEGTGPGAVVVSTYDSTATSPADYAGGRYLVVFDAGQNFATATIPIVDDMLYEGDEQFKIDLRYLTGEPIGDGTVTITESVATPQYSISDAVADEGDGAILFSITLHLEAGASLAHVAELYYHTHNLTAHAGSDYTATSNSAFFAPGAMDGQTVIFLRRSPTTACWRPPKTWRCTSTMSKFSAPMTTMARSSTAGDRADPRQ